MKKRTIWIIAIIMGLSFVSLLYLQISYIDAMVKMKKEQFDESVNRSLYQASRNLEMNETLRYLEKDVKETERKAYKQDSVMVDGLDGTIKHSHQFAVAADDGTVYSSFELKTFAIRPANVPKAMILRTDKNSISEASKSLQEIVRNRYIYQKALLDEVVYKILYTASDKPLKERINFKLLDQDIRTELLNNGINIPYHFRVETSDGREVYRCPEYSAEGEEYVYKQTLFRNDPSSKMGVVKVHFPNMSSYIFSSVRFMIPAVVFTVVLLLTFLFTIVVIFRQKRLTEIKNDFINNMTHELKTPIASISLAAQMMNDDSVTKSEQMTKHLSGVITDESKRLRFLVEKVLQMSMFDKKSIVFKKKELDLNEMVENIAQLVRYILRLRLSIRPSTSMRFTSRTPSPIFSTMPSSIASPRSLSISTSRPGTIRSACASLSAIQVLASRKRTLRKYSTSSIAFILVMCTMLRASDSDWHTSRRLSICTRAKSSARASLARALPSPYRCPY